jgi:hypothetical protein
MERNIVVRRDPALRKAWSTEMDAARSARRSGEGDREWHHLERAHILSQPMVGPHVRTHVVMLSTAIRRQDRREVVGQVFRLAVAGPGSVTGRYPLGNTGGADVSAFSPMPIPEDLQAVLDRLDTKETDSRGARDATAVG